MVLASGIALESGAHLLRPSRLAAASAKADHTIHIAPVSVELAPGRTISTIGYNGTVVCHLKRRRFAGSHAGKGP